MRLKKLSLYTALCLSLFLSQLVPSIYAQSTAINSTSFEQMLTEFFSISPSSTPDLQLEYIVQQEHSQSAEEIRTLPSNSWNTANSPLFLGDENNPVWVRFKLNPTENKANIINIDWPLISDIDLHVFNQTTQKWGQRESYSNWDIPTDYSSFPFFFHLDSQHNDELEIYFRVKTNRVFTLPINIYTSDELQALETKRNMLTGLFYGLILGLFCYNFFLFIFIRDKIYAFYCIYVGCIILYTLTTTGVGRSYIWNEIPAFNIYAYSFTASLSFLAACFFIRYFLSLHEWGKIFLWINNVAIGTWALIAVISCLPMIQIPQIIFDATAIFTATLGILMTFYLYIKGSIAAKYLMIAWTPLMIATLYLMFNLTGLVSLPTQSIYLQNTGFIIEVLLLSIALAERFNRERLERIQAQTSAAMAIQDKLNTEHRLTAELSETVERRTHELKQAMLELEDANDKLSALSYTDTLTQIHNRRFIDERVSEEFSRAQRQKLPLAILMCDLDFFKKINDTFGHPFGDICLRAAAQALKTQASRSEDVIGRYGGEEFMVILPGTSFDNALLIADKMRSSVDSIELKHQGKPVKLTCSIGVVGGVPHKHITQEALLDLSDQALYQAKQAGRNCVQGIQLPILQ